MMESEANAAQSASRRDLASGCVRTAIVWGPGVLLIVATAQFGTWVRTLGWVCGLLWLSGLCFFNYARSRRLHCIFTGPFFLAMAAIALLLGLGVISGDRNAWNALGVASLVGGVSLTYLPEMIWSRY